MRQFIKFDKSLFPANFMDDCDLKWRTSLGYDNRLSAPAR
jgi:hypothetical protein